MRLGNASSTHVVRLARSQTSADFNNDCVIVIGVPGYLKFSKLERSMAYPPGKRVKRHALH